MPITEKLKSILENIKSTGKIDENLLKVLSSQERKIVHDLFAEGLIDDALNFISDIDVNQDWAVLKEKMNSSKIEITYVPLWKSIMKYAAIFVGILTIIYFFRSNESSKMDSQLSKNTIKLKTGADAIKLIKEGEFQQIVTSSGKIVGVQKGNKISYVTEVGIEELIYSEIEIPYGKIFDIELSDGSVVHLNSGTKMRYPIKFLKGQKREVFIEGEAYFKVSEDKEHPFIVNAHAVSVEVLGTEFNISSYKKDKQIRTVLIEGSVSMTNSEVSKQNVILKPGQKASWDKSNFDTTVEEVDVDLYTGWIKGELVFRNSSFDDILQKLERSYGITIQNNNILLKDISFNASFNVNIETIEDVLKSISEIHKFEYQITSEKIIIK